MKELLKRLLHSRVSAWLAVVAMANGCAGALQYCVGHFRDRPDPTETALARLAALDPDERQKICAHRGNGTVKYRAAAILFDCVEIDLVIDPPTGGPIAVYHPPAENDLGVTFTGLLTGEACRGASCGWTSKIFRIRTGCGCSIHSRR